jgi:hypothetical protein
MSEPINESNQIQLDAEAQVKRIMEQLHAREVKEATQKAVEMMLAEAGVDLEAVAVEAIAHDRLNQMLQRDQINAANERARELYKAKTGSEFVE